MLGSAWAVLISAVIVIPATAARQWTNRLGSMVLLSACLGALAGVVSVEVDGPKTLIDLEYTGDAVLNEAKALLAEIEYPVSD